MRLRNFAFAPALIVILAGAAAAADINGKWKATMNGGQMAMEQTYTFKVDGGKITGTMTDEMMGEAKITSGTLNGDDIEFTVAASGQMGDMTFKFKGKVTGADEMKLSMSISGGPGGPGGGGPGGPDGPGGGGPGGPGGMELVAKRVK